MAGHKQLGAAVFWGLTLKSRMRRRRAAVDIIVAESPLIGPVVDEEGNVRRSRRFLRWIERICHQSVGRHFGPYVQREMRCSCGGHWVENEACGQPLYCISTLI